MVSLETVKTHVGKVLTKLGTQNRTHAAVVIAYESGSSSRASPVDGDGGCARSRPGRLLA
jgi:hypothetical protein